MFFYSKTRTIKYFLDPKHNLHPQKGSVMRKDYKVIPSLKIII